MRLAHRDRVNVSAAWSRLQQWRCVVQAACRSLKASGKATGGSVGTVRQCVRHAAARCALRRSQREESYATGRPARRHGERDAGCAAKAGARYGDRRNGPASCAGPWLRTPPAPKTFPHSEWPGRRGTLPAESIDRRVTVAQRITVSHQRTATNRLPPSCRHHRGATCRGHDRPMASSHCHVRSRDSVA